MPDRVKQAIFNILECHYGAPGELPPLRVADVFAGSGSMGFEALSRGASSCTFYEADRMALKVLRANIELLQAQKPSTVITRDAWKSSGREAGAGVFDLVFLDPPYRDTMTTGTESAVGKFLRQVAETLDRRAGAKLPLVVLHHFEKVRFHDTTAGLPWKVWDERRMGTNAVTFFSDREGEIATPKVASLQLRETPAPTSQGGSRNP